MQIKEKHNSHDPERSNQNNETNKKEKQPVILVVGACCLDRLVYVPKYPVADVRIHDIYLMHFIMLFNLF